MRTAIAAAALALAGCASTAFHSAPPATANPAAASATATAYAPYRFLIGEWNVTPAAGGDPAAIATFRWGPGESYIWFTVDLPGAGPQSRHLEGMLVWNGARGDLDMLLAIDPHGARAQEQGRLHALPDGSLVREITLIDASGKSGRFRQTFVRDGGKRILTAALRQVGEQWVATFPGSDRMVMTPRG